MDVPAHIFFYGQMDVSLQSNTQLLYMLGLVGKGFFIGILISAPMGPAGILCIQRTLSKGRWHGFASGLGAAFSDVIYAAITGLFIGLIINFIEAHQQLLEISGSIVIGIFGVYLFRSNPVKSLRKNRETKSSLVHDFVTAFLLTFSNMLVVFLYIGLFARFTFSLPTYPVWEMLAGLGGLAGIAIGAMLWWFAITTLVSKLQRWFNIRNIRLLNKMVGILIIILAVAGIFISLFSTKIPLL
jgi:threonine/homoserine/homoserine lactone efflux protein